ncbi:MAG: 3-isopropylmalate dehydratase small subunit [Candidatus Lustribacter sp.]|jgi:3-isopropylmalate dehydratase small subunit
MTPFETVAGAAVALLEDNVDTDAIAPLDVSRRPDYARMLFRRRREAARAAGAPFVLDRPAYGQARILVAGENFGCGSSRESAVWALAAFGIRCVVARSFAEAFRQNCLRNGVLPVVLAPGDAAAFEQLVVAADGAHAFGADLQAQQLTAPDGRRFAFAIDAHERTALLEGLDDIGLTLRLLPAIEAWEQRTRASAPHLQTLERRS